MPRSRPTLPTGRPRPPDPEEPTIEQPTAAPGRPRWAVALEERLDRLGAPGTPARDGVLAVAVAVVTLPVLAVLLRVVRTTEGPAALEGLPVPAVFAVCAAQALVLVLRRVRPLTCLGLVVAAQLALTALVPPAADVRALAPLVAGFAIGAALAPARAAAVAGVAVLAEGAGAVAVHAVTGADVWPLAAAQLLSAAASYLGGAFVGAYAATRRRYVDLLQERAEEAVRAQQARVTSAVAAERTRMARELHDIAAHHLSGMVVQAAAVERLIDRDPAAALAGTRWIRGQGRAVLEDLRLLVGILRDDGDRVPADDGRPVPGLAALDELVATARGLGCEVAWERSGEARDVPPVADVALFRMAQEALSNARQHAPGAPVRMALRYGRDVELVVENDAPARQVEPVAGSGGAGLVGMRERAHLVGVRLAVGGTPTGGWRVRAVLPADRAGVTA